MKTSGNTILITGGSSGIGLELARQFLGLGNTVIVTGRDLKKLRTAKEKLPALHTLQSDASKSAAIRSLQKNVVKKFPQLNILINNAGIMKKINFHDADTDLEEISQEIDINLVGTMRMAKQFLPHLKTKGEAAIVNVTSGLAFVPLPIAPVYCATKAGLHSFSQSLRVQLRDSPVKVFELAPPLTVTSLFESFDRDDMKGVPAMPVEELARKAILGISQDRFEIRPGASNLLKLMSRIAPEFILKQLSKSVGPMLAKDQAR